MVIGKAYCEIRPRAFEVQCRESLRVQHVHALLQPGAMLAPLLNRIVDSDTRRNEDRFPQLGDRYVFGLAGEYQLCPFRRREGHNGPVNLVPCDQFHCGLAGLRRCNIRTRDLGRILLCQQRWVCASDGQARRSAAKSSRDSILQPGWSIVEAGVLSVLESCENARVIGIKRGDEKRACLVRVLGNPADKRYSFERRRHDEFLSCTKSKSDLDSNFGQPIKFLFGGKLRKLLHRYHLYCGHRNSLPQAISLCIRPESRNIPFARRAIPQLAPHLLRILGAKTLHASATAYPKHFDP